MRIFDKPVNSPPILLMKTFNFFLLMCLALVCVAAEPAPKTMPLFLAEVTCFMGKIDSRSKCTVGWNKAPEPASKDMWSGAMTCGPTGQVSEIRWEFLGSEGGADVYQFTRRFPIDAPTSETVTKEIRFLGERLIIFEDRYQVVVIEPPKPPRIRKK